MDVQDLKVFEAVARHGGMKRAAEELATVQSNVTARIRALEGDLDVRLFDRHSRGVALTLEEGDPGTREMLERLVVGEEGHLDWIDTQLSMINDIGIERYLLTQVSDGG